MANIVLINPRFRTSYWGLEHALPLMGKRANQPVACLPLLAALTPAEHTVTLLDESVEPIDFDQVAKADIVGVTGMNVQRARMREILSELKKRGVFTVVGGPWVSVKEDYFGALADVIFVGEAEETWPKFLQDWRQGRYEKRYEQPEKSDMTRVPTPRFDLLKMQHYAFGSLQISRGCPFQCEFCDIIVTFGRRPRLKTSQQVIAEMEAMVAQRMNVVFIVDDNLIGNKKAIKVVLRDIIAWQQANDYPLIFFTEASLDLAEDAELLQLMVDANFVSVFIGIESPNEASLRETKKHQNVRPAGTMLERIHRVQDAGIEVWCGMILGFDHDDPGIFDAQIAFIRESRIAQAMVGMLNAIPKTPLHARLAAEGRLDPSDESGFGTNVIPMKMTREALCAGYIRVMTDLYKPEAYFERVEALYLKRRFQFSRTRALYVRPWTKLKGFFWDIVSSTAIFARLMCYVPDEHLRQEYRKRLVRFLRQRRDPAAVFVFTIKCAMHYHHYTMIQRMANGQSAIANSI